MTIKKAYVDVIAFLEENKNKKVSTIIDDLKAMCESKTQAKASIQNADGETIAVFCYYHKQWELLSEVDYGSKKSSSTGFNTMCKLGVKGWTRTQKAIKSVEARLLTEVMNGEIEPTELADRKVLLVDEARQAIWEDCAHEDWKYHTQEEIENLVSEEIE